MGAGTDTALRLAQNDAAYFAAGAQRRAIPGGNVLWMPGLAHLPIGCVVEVADSAACVASPAAFLSAASDALVELGAKWLRFYTQDSDRACDVAFAGTGLTASVELAFVCAAKPPRADWMTEGLRIRRTASKADWRARAQFAEKLGEAFFRKDVPPADWVEMERRKAEAGYMSCWLVRSGDEICASFGLAEFGSLLRLKNVLVSRDYRRRGIGRSIVAFGLSRAAARGFEDFGCYTFPGTSAVDLYQACGMTVVGSQTEWLGPLERIIAAQASGARAAVLAAASC
jgi:ribosomal protein S18 acetylase RimI-like enzyme